MNRASSHRRHKKSLFPLPRRLPGNLEALERRALLATLAVTSLNDAGEGSLREAIDLAASGDTLDLTGLSGTITLESELVLEKDLLIDGPGQSVLAISGNNSVRVFSQSGGQVAVDGLTIRNGAAGNGFGGAWRLEGGSVSFTGVRFFQNSAGEGGAIAAIAYDDENVSVTLTDSSVDSNTVTSTSYAGIGGGICLYALDGTEISSPGVLNFTMTRSTVASNIATGPTSALGGGIYGRASSGLDGLGGGRLNITLNNSTIAGNEARVSGTSPSITRGGGLHLEARGAEDNAANDSQLSVAINNTTVAKNVVQLGTAQGSAADGAGVYLATVGIVSSPIALTLSNSLFADNQNAGDVLGLLGSAINLTNHGYNLLESVANLSSVSNGVNNDIVGVDAKLGTLGSHGGTTPSVRLLYGSPAIDAGNDANAPTTDQRGVARLGTSDIGSYEWQNTAPTWPTQSLATTRVGVAYSETVAALDADAGQPLTISLVSGPDFIALQDNGDGSASLSGSPAISDIGTHDVTLRVSDGTSTTDVTLEITVRNSLHVSTTAENGAGSIRQAIADASAGDTIDLTGLTGTITLTAPIVLPYDLSFVGPGRDVLTISGEDQTGLFILGNDLGPIGVSFSHLTLADGSSDWGGAIRLTTNIDLHLSHVRITGSHASISGGAIASGDVLNSVTLIDTLIDHNSAVVSGGGVYIIGDASFTRTTFANNEVNAVQQVDGETTLSRGQGGAAYLASGTHTFINSTVAGNEITTASAAVRQAQGAGLYVALSTLSMTGVTLALNAVDVEGGGAGLHMADGEQPRLTLRNSLLAGNNGSVDAVVGGLHSESAASNNLVGRMATNSLLVHGTSGNLVGTVQSPVNARLGELDTHGSAVPTVRLRKGSPAINAASTSYASAADQRGVSRSGLPDIGAFEYVPPVNVPPAWTTSQLAPAKSSLPYSVVVGATDANPDETLTFTLLSGPSFLQLTNRGDGTATLFGTPAFSHIGTHPVQIRVSDGTDHTTLYTSIVISAPLAEVSNGTLYINGTNGNDVIEALLVSPTMIRVSVGSAIGNFALSGVSRIVVNGYDGHDSIKAQVNRLPTTIYGGSGNDTIRGGGGDDQIMGDAGHDYIDTGSGKNKASGGSGNDTLTGGNSADRLSGDEDNDVISGRLGPDILFGNDGDDYIDTGSDRNRANGGAGNDTLIGGNSADRLSGDAGNDSLVGNRGKDNISGGDGTDRARVDASDIVDSIEVLV